MNKALVTLCLIISAQFSFSQEKVKDTLSIENKQLLEACFKNIDNASDRDVKIYYESYLVKCRKEPTPFNTRVLEYLENKIKEN